MERVQKGTTRKIRGLERQPYSETNETEFIQVIKERSKRWLDKSKQCYKTFHPEVMALMQKLLAEVLTWVMQEIGLDDHHDPFWP